MTELRRERTPRGRSGTRKARQHPYSGLPRDPDDDLEEWSVHQTTHSTRLEHMGQHVDERTARRVSQVLAETKASH